MILDVVMPALVAGIHVLLRGNKFEDVDGRDIRAFTPVFDGLCPAMTRRVPEETMKRGIVVACVLALLGLADTTHAQTAQDYPARQVTLVLLFAPGGAIDIFARSFAQKLSDKFGKPFVVENRPGAGTVLAADSVARATTDGHTILVSPSPLAINATLYKKLPYDTANDFTAVAYVADIPLVLVVHPSLPVQSIPDLIKYAKDNPGKLSYASSGTGTTLHLSGEMLEKHDRHPDDPRAVQRRAAGAQRRRRRPRAARLRRSLLGDPADQSRQGAAAGGDLAGAAGERAGDPADRRCRRAWFRGSVMDRVHGARQDAGTGRREAARGTHRAAATPDMREQAIKLGMLPVTSPSLSQLRGFLPREIDRWGKLVQQAEIAGSE